MSTVSALAGLFPRWSRYIAHQPYPKQLVMLMLPHKEALFGGAAGSGKALVMATPCNAAKLGYNPDDPNQMEDFRMKCGSQVLTPFGFKLIDDIRVGDAVCNPDGTTCQVIAVHVPREQTCYKVEFSDGGSVIAGEDHLWSVKISGNRTRKKLADPYQSWENMSGEQRFNTELIRRYKTVTTLELKRLYQRACDDRDRGTRPRWPSVPLTEPCNFQASPGKANPVPAYTMGVWLGDGSSNQYSAYWSKPDQFVADEVAADIKDFGDVVSPRSDGKSFGINGGNIVECIRSVGLLGKKSYEKFVPHLYKHGTAEIRLSILNGLLDTDGYVDEGGQCSYDSTSQQLALDVQYLCRSLGYTATLGVKAEPTYEHNGEKRIGRPDYRLYITGRNRSQLFRLPRKKDRITELNNEGGRQVSRVVKMKQPLLTRCITVSHPNGLFITNDFIVTHNSDLLLMCALRYADVPGYSAILLRKTLTDLELEGNLIPRSHQWLSDTPAKWDGAKHRWTFPCGPLNRWDRPDFSMTATLQFGYMGQGYGNVLGMQKHRYQSAEFQFVGWDELTQHFEADYRYLFSRLRSKRCPEHGPLGVLMPNCRTCKEAYAVSSIPLYVRAATNPGGIGGNWVKKRFSIKKVGMDREGHAIFKGMNPDRPYIAATLEDNPSIKKDEYEASLEELARVERLQLRWGDWEVAADGRFQRKDFKLYSVSSNGEMLVLGKAGVIGQRYWPLKDCLSFITVDPAASIKEGPGDAQIWTNANPSRTAISSWLMTPDYHLCWRHTLAVYTEVPGIIPLIRQEASIYKPAFIGMENNGFNIAIFQAAQRSGLTMKPYSPLSGDKLVRATPAQIRAERGQIWVPEPEIGSDWLEDALSEVCNWTGHPQEVDDVVDTLAYAASEVHNRAHGVEKGGKIAPWAV